MIMMWFFLIVSGLALAAAASLVMWEVRRLRANQPVADEPLFLCDFLPRVNKFYGGFAGFFYRLGHQLSFYTLLGLHQLVVIFKLILARVEKRFVRLIDAVQGRGVIGKRGSASLFLLKIKDKTPS